MPRLGDTSSNNNRDADTRRNAAMAYQQARNRFPISNLLLVLFFTLIFRNMFFHDYRKEEINSLKASGKTADQISKLVPQTAAERREQALHGRTTDLDILKSQVKVLEDEVKLLKARLEKRDSDEEDDSEEIVEEEPDHAPPPPAVEDEETEEADEEEMGDEEEEVEDEEEEPEIVELPKPIVAHSKPKTRAAKKTAHAAAVHNVRGSAAKKTTKRVSAAAAVSTKKTTKKKRHPAVGLEPRADPIVV